MSQIDINYSQNLIKVRDACLDNSTFECVSVKGLYFNDVDLSGTKITNANMSNLEIEGAQLGGAIIRNVGMPPVDHPNYDAKAKQRPLIFENCDFEASTITDCNLANIAINNCNIKGMTINGISVEELLKNFTHNNNK